MDKVKKSKWIKDKDKKSEAPKEKSGREDSRAVVTLKGIRKKMYGKE